MQCPNCRALLDEDTIYCGNCGRQVAPVQARGATATYSVDGVDRGDEPTSLMVGNSLSPMALHTSPPPRYNTPSPSPEVGSARAIPSIPPPTPRGRLNVGRVIMVVVLALLVVIGGTAGILALTKKGNNPTGSSTPAAGTSGATGSVSFLDGQDGHTNALKIQINNLVAAPAGSHYAAWFINSQNEESQALGTLTTRNGALVLNYAGDATNLLSLGDKVEVTLEQANTNVPTGKVVLSATFPPLAYVHIKHLLLSFPNTPGKIGLLVGLRDQAQKLNISALLLQNTLAGGNVVAERCLAQSIIDLIEGAQGTHYAPLSALCAALNINEQGDGYGMLNSNSYIHTAEQHAGFAASAPDSTAIIRVHAQHVAIALENVRGWLTTINQDAVAFLQNPANTSKINEIVTLSNHALNGVDINSDESIDPVPGEAGATTAYLHGQLMATLLLN